MPEPAASKGALLLSYLMSKRVIAVITTFSVIALLIHLRSVDSAPNLQSYLPIFSTSNRNITTPPLSPASKSSSGSLYSIFKSPFHHDVEYDSALSSSKVPTGYSIHGVEETEEVHSSHISTSNFWPQFYAALTAATPRVSLPREGINAHYDRFKAGATSDHREDLIKLHDDDAKELATAHSWFVEQITRTDFPKPHYIPGSQGIVTTAGGHYLPEVIVAIRMLRRTGSTLPVDVFFGSPDEAEPELCEKVLASLGARCHTISELVDTREGNLPHRQTISKYQLKVFALLLSDFDDMLWMDTDEISLQDPAEFFKAEPFSSTGLVLWPDYWTNTASPLFFRTANITGDRIPSVADRASSETGQLLMSKSRQNQLHTLELAAYYNFHGPSHFYKLLSQGAIGEGDKETFLAAALALDAPFWAVQTDVETIGAHNDISNDWHGAGIVQADPRSDYAKYSGKGDSSIDKVTPAFIHTTVDKPNAGRYVRHWRSNVRARIWQFKHEIVEKFGYDIEQAWWEEMKWTACSPEMNGYVFKDWINNPEHVDENPSVCDQVKDVMADLFGEEDPFAAGIGATTPSTKADGRSAKHRRSRKLLQEDRGW